jgi:hypothetical protein
MSIYRPAFSRFLSSLVDALNARDVALNAPWTIIYIPFEVPALPNRAPAMPAFQLVDTNKR